MATTAHHAARRACTSSCPAMQTEQHIAGAESSDIQMSPSFTGSAVPAHSTAASAAQATARQTFVHQCTDRKHCRFTAALSPWCLWLKRTDLVSELVAGTEKTELIRSVSVKEMVHHLCSCFSLEMDTFQAGKAADSSSNQRITDNRCTVSRALKIDFRCWLEQMSSSDVPQLHAIRDLMETMSQWY